MTGLWFYRKAGVCGRLWFYAEGGCVSGLWFNREAVRGRFMVQQSRGVWQVYDSMEKAGVCDRFMVPPRREGQGGCSR